MPVTALEALKIVDEWCESARLPVQEIVDFRTLVSHQA
jgi:hypothetical protein